MAHLEKLVEHLVQLFPESERQRDASHGLAILFLDENRFWCPQDRAVSIDAGVDVRSQAGGGLLPIARDGGPCLSSAVPSGNARSSSSPKLSDLSVAGGDTDCGDGVSDDNAAAPSAGSSTGSSTKTPPRRRFSCAVTGSSSRSISSNRAARADADSSSPCQSLPQGSRARAVLHLGSPHQALCVRRAQEPKVSGSVLEGVVPADEGRKEFPQRRVLRQITHSANDSKIGVVQATKHAEDPRGSLWRSLPHEMLVGLGEDDVEGGLKLLQAQPSRSWAGRVVDQNSTQEASDEVPVGHVRRAVPAIEDRNQPSLPLGQHFDSSLGTEACFAADASDFFRGDARADGVERASILRRTSNLVRKGKERQQREHDQRAASQAVRQGSPKIALVPGLGEHTSCAGVQQNGKLDGIRLAPAGLAHHTERMGLDGIDHRREVRRMPILTAALEIITQQDQQTRSAVAIDVRFSEEPCQRDPQRGQQSSWILQTRLHSIDGRRRAE
eukprot:scaffold736_cov254-Pinguiococcus_pyrenoidosus.AAC.4